MDDKKEIMIIDRILSPPYENRPENIYTGEVIPFREIPEILGLDIEESKKYYFSVSHIKIGDKKLKINSDIYDIKDFLRSGEFIFHSREYRESEINLSESVRNGLLKLLS